MDEISKLVLDLCRDEIVQDLDPKYIIEDLINLGVINDEQRTRILSEQSEETQARLLTEIIDHGSCDAFSQFISSLRNEGKYNWLADSLEARRELATEEFDHFKTLLTVGGVPHLPPHMLIRCDLQKHIKKMLKKVFKQMDSGWAVIHGMGGSGKSTLAAASVRDFKLIHTLFPQGIYWIKIGNNVTDESLLIKMHILCEKLDSSYRGNIPCSLEMAAERLRILFTDKLHKKSLIILDDVWDDNTIRHFDFGCRILLTTRNKSIMSVTCRDVLLVEIRVGFSLVESQQFLADSLKMKTRDLPRRLIEQIHCSTKGSPMVMAIISANVRRYPKNTTEALERCLAKLKDNSFLTDKKKTPYEYPCIAQALELSVESLEEENLLEYYYDLAVFPNDFYIIGKVLATFWKKELYEVTDIMTNFVEKSVAIQVSNGHASNSYNIHDLYIYYLKNKLGDSLMSRHKRLINHYLESCDHKYEDLPDDGYILQYLGHHLNGAHMFEAFPEVFLNLKVLIAKLKSTGPADLLGDFERYEIPITQNGQNEKKFEDFKEFASSNAHLLTNSRYDKLQVALCQPSCSEVFQQAQKICIEGPHKAYYEWCNRDKLKNSCILSTQVYKHKVSCARFSSDGKYIISAGKDAVIKILKSDSGREVLNLEGHTSDVTWLANCADPKDAHKEIILSSSVDTTVMVWYASSRHLKNNKKVKKLTSPAMVFKNHSTKVVSCCLLSDGNTAASMGQNGEVKVWNIRSGSELASWEAHCESFNIGHCDLAPDGNKLVSTAGTFLRLWDISKKLPEWEQEDRRSQFSSACFTSTGKEVLATLDYKVIVYTVDAGVVLFSLIEPNRVTLLHCAISETFVAASTNGQSVVVWNKETREVLDYHHGHKGCVCSVSFSPPIKENNNIIPNEAEFRIVSSGNDGTIMVWKTSPLNEKLEVILREVFSVQFDSSNEPLIAVVDMNNKIKVYNGQQTLLAAENGSLIPALRIHCCALTHNRDKVLYGCTNGSLKLFDIRSNTTKTLYNSKYESTTKQESEVNCCIISKDDKVMVAGHGDGGIYIWRNDVIQTEGHSAHVTFLKFFNNDRNFASCSFDNSLKVWNANNGALKFTCRGHDDSVVSCDISTSNELIVSASTDKSLMIWAGSSGLLLGQCVGHEDCVRMCAFSPIGNLLASGDDSGIVKLWTIDKAVLREAVAHENGLANGNSITEGCKSVEPISTISSGKCNSWIHDLSFSADGSKFVVCSDVIQCWSYCATTDKNSGPRLLQTFPIRGSKVGHIYSSKNFESFVAIDDTGVLYHLRLLPRDNKDMLVNNI